MSSRYEYDRDGLAPPKGSLNEARWSEILKVAEDVFFEKGYQATTVQEIASRVGLLKGSLYYYIQNKQDLFYQVLARANRQYLRDLQADPRITKGDAVSRLSHFVDRYMAQLDRDPPWNRFIEHDAVVLDPHRLASLKALRHQIDTVLKDIIVQGITEGVFDPATDPSVATNTIFSLMNATNRWRHPTGRRTYQEITDWYKHFILKGLTPT